MTVDEALKLIDNVVSQVHTDRNGHIQISQAMTTLGAAVRDSQKPQEVGDGSDSDK